jgi:nucleotide-binding universal stress UspA family protein
MFKHILIPTDGSEVAAKAIRAGVRLAAEMGAKVTGLYAQEPHPLHLPSPSRCSRAPASRSWFSARAIKTVVAIGRPNRKNCDFPFA